MLMVILRFVHIFFGALWVGSVFALTLVVAPGFQALNLSLDPVMKVLTHRKFPQMMAAFGGLTVLAGLTMLWKLSGGFQPSFMNSHFGIALSLGGATAIIAFAIGIVIQRPAADKVAALRAELASSPPKGDDPRMAEIARLQNRVVSAGKIVARLLLFTLAAMAVARYI